MNNGSHLFAVVLIIFHNFGQSHFYLFLIVEL